MNGAPRLPAGLPSVADARLPLKYEAAKTALAECASIDECFDWANKADAMAAYARMSEDDTLRKQCDRIQARALRRCGELLKEYNSPGARTDLEPNDGGDGGLTQGQAAKDAGMSERQQVTAVRVANVPDADFETQVESDSPPTVTALAEQGKKTRNLVDLQGRAPEEYSMATSAQAHLRDFAKFAGKTDPAVVARGTKPHEVDQIIKHIAVLDGWLDVLATRLER